MKAVFIELPPFERYRQEYLTDEQLRLLQGDLLKNPHSGSVIQGTGGLRKMRFGRAERGKRGDLRIIYYWWLVGHQFWLFTLYQKGEVADLSPKQRQYLAQLLKLECEARLI